MKFCRQVTCQCFSFSLVDNRRDKWVPLRELFMWREHGCRLRGESWTLEEAFRWESPSHSLLCPIWPMSPALTVTSCQSKQSQGKGCFHDNTSSQVTYPGSHLLSFSPLSNTVWGNDNNFFLIPRRQLGDTERREEGLRDLEWRCCFMSLTSSFCLAEGKARMSMPAAWSQWA